MITAIVGTAAVLEPTSKAITANVENIELKITPHEVYDNLGNIELNVKPEKLTNDMGNKKSKSIKIFWCDTNVH